MKSECEEQRGKNQGLILDFKMQNYKKLQFTAYSISKLTSIMIKLYILSKSDSEFLNTSMVTPCINYRCKECSHHIFKTNNSCKCTIRAIHLILTKPPQKSQPQALRVVKCSTMKLARFTFHKIL